MICFVIVGNIVEAMYCGSIIVVCEYNGSVSKCIVGMLKLFVSIMEV